jgi:hypothetical protein
MKVKITVRTIVKEFEAPEYIFIAEITSLLIMILASLISAAFEENKRMLRVQWVLQFVGLFTT